MYNFPSFSSSVPTKEGYVHNLDFSGFMAVIDASYAQLQEVDPRVECSLPFCVYQHSCTSRLNAQIIRYLQVESGENRYRDEGSSYDVFLSKNMPMRFHPLVHEYLQGLGTHQTANGILVKPNIPKGAIPALTQYSQTGVKIAGPGTFGVLNATTHNYYECYVSPYVTKSYIEVSRTLNPGSEWDALPEALAPDKTPTVRYTENLLGYRSSEKIAPSAINQILNIKFDTSDSMAGRLAYSEECEQMVNSYLGSVKDKITIREGFPTFEQNNSLSVFVENSRPTANTQRTADLLTNLLCVSYTTGPINCRAAILALTRRRHESAPGLCLDGLPEATETAYVATRNSNFIMTAPFSKSKEIFNDLDVLRTERFISSPPISTRYDILKSFCLQFSKIHSTKMLKTCLLCKVPHSSVISISQHPKDLKPILQMRFGLQATQNDCLCERCYELVDIDSKQNYHTSNVNPYAQETLQNDTSVLKTNEVNSIEQTAISIYQEESGVKIEPESNDEFSNECEIFTITDKVKEENDFKSMDQLNSYQNLESDPTLQRNFGAFAGLIAQTATVAASSRRRHYLKEVEGQKRVTRRRCVGCYKRLSKEQGSPYARRKAKRINTICDLCALPMCLVCFQEHID